MIAAFSEIHHDINKRRLFAISLDVQSLVVLRQNVFVEFPESKHEINFKDGYRVSSHDFYI